MEITLDWDRTGYLLNLPTDYFLEHKLTLQDSMANVSPLAEFDILCTRTEFLIEALTQKDMHINQVNKLDEKFEKCINLVLLYDIILKYQIKRK